MTEGSENAPPIHVLLVDDDPDLRRLLAWTLNARGMSVVTAGSAQEALAVAADPRVHIDVVVMDIVLPDSWGAQVALENTLFRPDAKVIFISGHSRQDAILEASASADDVHFLAKPFGVDELADLIRKVMDEPSKIEESPGEER